MIYHAYRFLSGEIIPEIETISEAKKQIPKWFSNEAMAFFKSRLESEIFGHNVFITSEQFEEEKRSYSIRLISYSDIPYSADIYISNLGDFCQYDSLEEAKEIAREYLKNRGNEEKINLINILTKKEA